MSNPTIATKLITLVKGIFGRKDPVATTGPEKKDATPVTETAEQETAEAPQEKVTEDTVAEAPAATTETTEVAASADEPVSGADAPAQDTDASETTTLVEEPRGEPAGPATEDVPEDGPALAEEITVAEAHTTVASDEVLEKVRKGAAPEAEELAVPTYDELTLPSIRARLRKLTIEQVRDLRAYEVAHRGRPEFIKMYDNRIAKLEADA
ncbi:hypothetical protein [Nocardiopsis sp. MG754419]|uniref:hypothetical protein n=1 Tax=Nocardiopsis sp. MG754419 TaxID=2259865 RepID=UPI001BACC8F8|nr:hypothetical protein [Nocardiopsis sp. MG754419]MBR8744469.1 hypothetical protein [Nocardiopsis sp. MG754419]